MNVHISFKVRKTPDIEKEILHITQKLQKRLQVFRPELVHLKGIVEELSSRKTFAVTLNLRLPSGQMAAQKSAATPATALRAASDDLLLQLNKHKSQLRNAHKWPRWRRGSQERPAEGVPFEQTLAAVQAPTISSDDIRSYVNANLSRLEHFVEVELLFREAAEQIPANSIMKEEIIDEVIARALEEGVEKPERLALEPWLYRLALRVIGDLPDYAGEEGQEVRLEQTLRSANAPASDEAELQFHQPDESFTEESVIADRRASTPEDIAYSEEMIALVQSAMHGASPVEKEAFILHVMEGFSVEEISAITTRSAEEILGAIAAARRRLRQSVPLAGRFKGKLLQQTGSA
ncbi:MAG: hypothetical protein JST79_02535 [Acidobacteria bacterium]|jgi:DNA-directed RNA polymerase specialized sigma24 family protein/ribosome-associated translation inhibitor RaiA|nr:hypothetical protein [Acidobacteriota bacterium]